MTYNDKEAIYFKNQLEKSWINFSEDKNKIVLCDFDGTLYRNSLFLDILYKIFDNISDNQENKNRFLKFLERKNEWKQRKIDYDEFLNEAIIIYEEVLKQISYDKFKEIVAEISDNFSNNLYTFTYNKLNELKKNWYIIIFVSWSPLEIVEKVVEKLWFDCSIWTVISQKEWIINWREEILMARDTDKEKFVKYLKNNVKHEILISFWDTGWDRIMLKNSDSWYAINPNYSLFKFIIENKLKHIKIIIERKNLILELDYNNFINKNNYYQVK